jgi:hypothetical protein
MAGSCHLLCGGSFSAAVKKEAIMNVPLAVRMTIQERRVERRQGERRRSERELAETNVAIGFMRGLLVGCFSTLITVGLIFAILKVIHA